MPLEEKRFTSLKEESKYIDTLKHQLNELCRDKSGGSANLHKQDMLNIEKISFHLKTDGVSIDTPNPLNGWTMLSYAAAKGYVESVCLLLSLKANPNVCVPPV